MIAYIVVMQFTELKQLRRIVREVMSKVPMRHRRLNEASPFNDDESPELIAFVQDAEDSVLDAAVNNGVIDELQRDDARELVQLALENLFDELRSGLE